MSNPDVKLLLRYGDQFMDTVIPSHFTPADFGDRVNQIIKGLCGSVGGHQLFVIWEKGQEPTRKRHLRSTLQDLRDAARRKPDRKFEAVIARGAPTDFTPTTLDASTSTPTPVIHTAAKRTIAQGSGSSQPDPKRVRLDTPLDMRAESIGPTRRHHDDVTTFDTMLDYGRTDTQTVQAKRFNKVLLLASDFIARPVTEYIIRSSLNRLTVASYTLGNAETLCKNLDKTRAVAISLNISDVAALEREIAAHDLVISLVPSDSHQQVIKAAIKGKTHVVTPDCVSPAIRKLDTEIKKAGIIVMQEVCLDLGIEQLYAARMIEEVHAKGGKVKQFTSYAGSMPAPECADNALGYRVLWNSRTTLLSFLRNTSFFQDSKVVDVTGGDDVFASARPYYLSPASAFVAYPTGDSKPFRVIYDIPEAETVIRGVLYYPGFPAFVKAFFDIGFINPDPQEWLKEAGLTWAQVTQKTIGAADSTEATLVEEVKSVCEFSDASEAQRIISGLREIGLFSSEKATIRANNLLDTLGGRLKALMNYKDGGRDFIVLQHKFLVQWRDSTESILTSTFEAYGKPKGHAAIALANGLPCGIAAQLVLDGSIRQTGIRAPYSMEISDTFRESLKKEGLGFLERRL